MLYPNAQNWADWGVTVNLHQFFALHWTEMFDHETTDTWQVRTCNIRTILEEIVEASKTVERIKTYTNVLRSLLAEAFSVIPHDAVVTRFYPFVLCYLDPWKSKKITEENAPELGRVAQVVLGNLNGYWKHAVDILIEIISEQNGNRKQDLYAAAMTLAVETLARGHSPGYIRRLFLERVLCVRAEPFPDRVSEVFNLLSRAPAEYSCTFITKGIKQLVADILPDDITLQVGTPAAIGAGPETTFYSRGNQNSIYLRISVTAVDQEAARHLAEQRLFQFFAGLNLYGLEVRFDLAHSDALVECDDGTKLLVEKSGEPAYLSNTNLMHQRAATLLRVHQRLGTDDAAQVMAALQYHRLALTATSDEARFINLWVALESLCQGGSGSIISRVCTRIPPCVSTTNLKKTIGSLARYIRYMWVDADVQQFLALFPNSTETHLRQEDLLRVMLLKPGSADLAQLFALTSRHPLICQRVYRVKTRILDCPKSVADNLRYTRRNVEWQLKRIYRVRNDIVHKGSSSPRILRQLTQHLHTYLVTTLQGIVYELDRQPKWSMRDALEHKRRLFDHLATFFETTDGDKIAQQTLLNPIACLETQNTPLAWVKDDQSNDYQI